MTPLLRCLSTSIVLVFAIAVEFSLAVSCQMRHVLSTVRGVDLVPRLLHHQRFFLHSVLRILSASHQILSWCLVLYQKSVSLCIIPIIWVIHHIRTCVHSHVILIFVIYGFRDFPDFANVGLKFFPHFEFSHRLGPFNVRLSHIFDLGVLIFVILLLLHHDWYAPLQSLNLHLGAFLFWLHRPLRLWSLTWETLRIPFHFESFHRWNWAKIILFEQLWVQQHFVVLTLGR